MPDLSPFLRTTPVVNLGTSQTYQVQPSDQTIQVQNNAAVNIALPPHGARGQVLNIEDVSGSSQITLSGTGISFSWSNYGIAQIRWDELTQKWLPVQIPNSHATPPPIPPTGLAAGTYQGITFNTAGQATAAVNMNYLTANQTVTLSGDVSGSGATAITATVTGLQGRPVAATAPTTNYVLAWSGSQWAPVAAPAGATTLTGDVTGTGTGTVPTTLATVNSNVGTFQGLTVNAKGLVTAAVNQNYLTANQTITLSGDTTGSGTTAITTTTGRVNGVTYPASPSTNTVPVITATNTVTYETVPNAALANMAANTLKGNNTASAATPIDLTAAQVSTLLGLGPLATQAIPATVAQGGTGLTGGTSGGVPYYSAAAAIASSAALANGQVVVGGGAGAAPATIANGQLPATATNDSATAGHVGEYIVSTVASPGVSLTSGAIANITNISLTAGDWDVEGMIAVAPSATVTATEGWVNNVSVTAPALGINGQFYSNVSFTFLSISSTGCRRFSLAATTTIYLSLTASFASGTCTAYGEIRARRMR